MIKIEDIKIYNEEVLKDLEYILENINSKDCADFNILGTGSEGFVYGYKQYAIKLFHEHCILYEFEKTNTYILSKLQNMSSYPKLYAGNNEIMIYEFIDGVLLSDCFEEELKKCKSDCLDVLLKDIEKTLNKNILYQDLHDENIILNNNGYFKIIDVGRFKKVNENAINYYLTDFKHENIDYTELIENIFLDYCFEAFEYVVENICCKKVQIA